MDASNEHWTNRERRQKKLDTDGIHYVGMGVSGGYQAARHWPSTSPGGSREALELVMPCLEKVTETVRKAVRARRMWTPC